MKHTKIVATFGPAVDDIDRLVRLQQEGVNAFRVNCSHGDESSFRAAAGKIKEAGRNNEFPIGLLFDISGPKLRLDRFKGEYPLEVGDELSLTAGETKLKDATIGVNHPAIIDSVNKGDRLFVDDGNICLEVTDRSGDEIRLKSLTEAVLLPGKGVNLPDSGITIPTISEKDKRDIKTAVEVGADFIALSFVRSGDDIIEARKLLQQYGGRQKVLAKLERREAVETLEDILMLSDGVMIARGDLGVELPPDQLPRLQKQIIRMANRHRKPVIVATQMLESMRFAPRATRAEINDVASAVFDKADAVMLSAETATGGYPTEAVRTMTATIVDAEKESATLKPEIEQSLLKSPIPYAIAEAVMGANQYCKTDLIYAFTTSGYTAELISNLFPPQSVIALSPDQEVCNQLSLFRSVYAVRVNQPQSFDDMLTMVNDLSLKRKLTKRGNRVIMTGGAPFGSNSPTNFMLVHEVF